LKLQPSQILEEKTKILEDQLENREGMWESWDLWIIN
jgi:hypothetical protein